MRVVAGSARGTRLRAPTGDRVRPTTDRVREAVFNALHSLGAVDGARVLDGFAGSGALGIEALSRGASAATFVEPDRVARGVVEENLRAAGVADRATVVADRIERALGRAPLAGDRFDLVLLDPPYAFDDWPVLLGALTAVVADEAVVVVESGAEVPLPPGWGVVRSKRYGTTLVVILRPPTTPPE